MTKIPISVIALFMGKDTEISSSKIPVGRELAARHKVIPIKFLTPSGDIIIIDRITDIRRQVSAKVGGLGERYSCLATIGDIQRLVYAYKDEDEWYLEEML
jgi:sulfopyruvate decarboxylase TPP-binding subunit